MTLDGGVIYDGELSIWDLGSRTSTGFFTVNEAVGRDAAFQVTVTGLTGGGKQAVFDFDGAVGHVRHEHRFLRGRAGDGQHQQQGCGKEARYSHWIV